MYANPTLTRRNVFVDFSFIFLFYCDTPWFLVSPVHGFPFFLMLNCTVVYVEWLWMQKDRQSSTLEEGEDMVGGSDQNVLEETAG